MISSQTTQYTLSEDAPTRDLFNRRTLERDAAHLVPRLRAGMRVADLGCGAGSLTLGIAATVAPGEVLGVDLQPGVIERARAAAADAGLRNVQFEIGNIDGLELPEASFDVVHFSGTLSYLKDPLAALKLALRALKPGGLVAAREPHKGGDWFGGPCAEAITLFFQVAMLNWRADGGDPCLGVRLWSLLREAGFEQIEQWPMYSPALSDVQATARAVLPALDRADLRDRAVARGWVTRATWDRLAEQIATWAADETAVAAFAECSAIAVKPDMAQSDALKT
jgi:SAM-dependent methyltransferase